MRETPSIDHIIQKIKKLKKTEDNADMEARKTPWYLNTFFTNFIAGGTSASAAVTAIAPFERIKLLLQVQKSAKNIAPADEYKGILDCLRRIPKEQGILSFWRGNSASIIRCFPYQALNFSVKDKLREIFSKSIDISLFSHRMMSNLLAGGIAGSTALTLIYPLDYARTRLAVDTGGFGSGKQREFTTIRHTIMSTYKSEGRKGIYRGFSSSVFGVFLYRSTYFGIFDTGVETLPTEYRHSFWAQFILAETSAIVGSTISYPLDTVRRSMMMQSGREVKLYQSSWECYQILYAKYGLKGFYHGGLANVMRGTGGALMLIFYDKAQTHVARFRSSDGVVVKSEPRPGRPYIELPNGLIGEHSKKTNTEGRFHFCLF